ncbi:FACT complex subunit [Microbotryomycetes sp. JL221]|nr:FACT complex subunit [Microbotryomycetes sp. JL221]
MKRASNDASAEPVTKRKALVKSTSLTNYFDVVSAPKVASPICTSDPLTDRRSTFIAHAAPVTTPTAAVNFQNHIRALEQDGVHPREAEHEMYAARFLTLRAQKDGTQTQDWTVKLVGDDDGEKGGSNAIKKILERTGAVDICCVVTRYYGGILLGQDRFAHIQSVAEQAILRLQEQLELPDLIQQIRLLDDRIDELLAAEFNKTADNEDDKESQAVERAIALAAQQAKYANLDRTKAERVLLARQRRIEMLEARQAASRQREESEEGAQPAISSAQLASHVARNYQLRIGTSKGRITFDGFLKDDFEKLQNTCRQHYNQTIETKDISVRGWNWGVAEVQAQDMAFLVAGKPAFTIPLDRVANTTITKAEVALEFTPALSQTEDPNEDAVTRKKRFRALPDEIAELRLYIPGSAKGMKKKSDKAKIKAEGVKGEDGKPVTSEDEDEDDDDDEGEGDDGETAAQVFHDAVKEKADIGQITGEGLCTIPDVLCLTPRGRFDIDMHPDFLRLRGKTYDYRIAYNQVQKLFLLPKPDDIHCQFVVNIDPPIRQGQTRYPYLVMQFVKDEIMELELNIDDETNKDKYDGALQPRYDDPGFEVVSILFRILAGKKVVTPGSFQSHDGQSAVKCNLKANEGHLYLLEKQLLFISKQPTLVPFSDIHSITVARVGGALPSARTFDLSVRLRADGSSIVFSAVNKEELQSIEEFLKVKKLRVKNEMEELAAAEAAVLGDDDDDDDDDDMSVDGDARAKTGMLDEDEDSEVDEDFQASSSDGGSATSDSEDDEDGGDASNDDDDDEDGVMSLDVSSVVATATKLLPTVVGGNDDTVQLQQPFVLRNATDAVALVVHAMHTDLGFRLIKVGSQAVQPPSSSASDSNDSSSTTTTTDNNKLPREWTQQDTIKFHYRHDQSSLEFVVSVSELGDRLFVAATAIENNKSHSFDIVTNDYLSRSALPLNQSDSIETAFASTKRLQDLIVLYRLNVLQAMVPGLRKEGYTELSSSRSASEQGETRPVGSPEGPYYPDSGGPLMGTGPHRGGPGRGGQPPMRGDPGGFDPLGGIGGGAFGPGRGNGGAFAGGSRSPFDVGRSDLLPLGGMGGTFGPPGSLGGGGPGPGSGGGGMYVGRDHPMFRDRFSDDQPLQGGSRLWGGDGFLPSGAVPPGARFDPIVPGNAPPTGQIQGGNMGSRGQQPGQGRGPQGSSSGGGAFSGEPDWDGERAPGSSGNDYDAMFG